MEVWESRLGGGEIGPFEPVAAEVLELALTLPQLG